MLRNLLSNLNLNNTKFETIMKMTTEDIKFNRTSFGKRRTLKDMLSIVLRRCIDLDGTTIYTVITGQAIADIAELTTEELKCILGIKKEFPKEPK